MKFIFLLSPPRSGTTVYANIFRTSRSLEFLQPRAEGQWLTSELNSDKKWDDDYRPNFQNISHAWLNKVEYIKRNNPSCRIIFEKSPPNMLRIEELSMLFPDNFIFASNRNPLAYIASSSQRSSQNYDIYKQIIKFLPMSRNKTMFCCRLANLSRTNLIKGLALQWIYISDILMSKIQKLSLPCVSYERFCSNPSMLFDILPPDYKSCLNDIDFYADILIKDYQPQSIENQNKKQISSLSHADLDVAFKMLSKRKDLLEFFDYRDFC